MTWANIFSFWFGDQQCQIEKKTINIYWSVLKHILVLSNHLINIFSIDDMSIYPSRRSITLTICNANLPTN